MSSSRSVELAVDFDETLSILQGWLGRELIVNLEASHPLQHLASMRGPLAPGPAIADPRGGEYAFNLGTGSFSISRDCFAGACFYPFADHLIILLDDRALAPHLAAFTIHVLLVSASDEG